MCSHTKGPFSYARSLKKMQCRPWQPGAQEQQTWQNKFLSSRCFVVLPACLLQSLWWSEFGNLSEQRKMSTRHSLKLGSVVSAEVFQEAGNFNLVLLNWLNPAALFSWFFQDRRCEKLCASTAVLRLWPQPSASAAFPCNMFWMKGLWNQKQGAQQPALEQYPGDGCTLEVRGPLQ